MRAISHVWLNGQNWINYNLESFWFAAGKDSDIVKNLTKHISFAWLRRSFNPQRTCSMNITCLWNWVQRREVETAVSIIEFKFTSSSEQLQLQYARRGKRNNFSGGKQREKSTLGNGARPSNDRFVVNFETSFAKTFRWSIGKRECLYVASVSIHLIVLIVCSFAFQRLEWERSSFLGLLMPEIMWEQLVRQLTRKGNPELEMIVIDLLKRNDSPAFAVVADGFSMVCNMTESNSNSQIWSF